MKTYEVHTESWANATPVGLNADGSTAMRFDDLRETVLPITGFLAAVAEAKAQRQGIDASGRHGAVAVRDPAHGNRMVRHY